jgi:hypothetical protein
MSRTIVANAMATVVLIVRVAMMRLICIRQ